MQIMLKNNEELKKNIIDNNYKNTLVVCGHSFYKSDLYVEINNFYKENKLHMIFFDRFTPNPTYEEVCDGVDTFKRNKCDSIIVVGGGSAIDVAKCIKMFLGMNDNELYLDQKIRANTIPFIAIPTTAGTGSEATHFAVIYYNGSKKSIADLSCIPDAVLFVPSFLKTLPIYQKKSTILDAYSHAIESLWSVNSNEESSKYAKEAIELITNNIDLYLDNDESTFMNVMNASNLAGKAINISKTTAGHAMCYKLTSLYGISHGHATMLVNSELYPYMLENKNKCIDKRGITHLEKVFKELDKPKDYFRKLISKLNLYDVNIDYKDIDLLTNSVNLERLSNHPIELEKEDIKEIYKRIFNRIEESKK